MMRLGRTTFLHFLSHVVRSVAGFAARFTIAYLLGSAILGQYSLIVGLGFVWFTLLGTAVARATTKRVSEGVDREAFLTAGFLLNVVVSAVTGAAIYAGAVVLEWSGLGASTTFVSVLTAQKELVTLLAMSAIAFRTALAGLAGQKLVAHVGGLEAVERVLRSVIQICLILAGASLVGLVVGHVGALVIVAGVAFAFYKVGVARPTRTHFVSILEYTRHGWVSTLQSRVFGWLDVIVLSFFVADGLIGIYEVAWGLGSLLSTISVSVRSTLFPEISELAVDERYDRIRHYLGEGIFFSGLFVIPGFFGSLVIGERVLKIYGSAFGEGYGILLILIAAYVADVYASQFVTALNAINRPDVTYRINLLFVASNLVLNVGLIYAIGWYGAAIATCVSALIRVLLAYRSFADLLGHPDVPLTDIGWQLVAAGVMLVAVFGADTIAPGSREVTVALVLFGVAVYLLVLLGFSRLARTKAVGLYRSFHGGSGSESP